jgi:hypothetical protein
MLAEVVTPRLAHLAGVRLPPLLCLCTIMLLACLWRFHNRVGATQMLQWLPTLVVLSERISSAHTAHLHGVPIPVLVLSHKQYIGH